jgi:hypothetical protein
MSIVLAENWICTGLPMLLLLHQHHLLLLLPHLPLLVLSLRLGVQLCLLTLDDELRLLLAANWAPAYTTTALSRC